MNDKAREVLVAAALRGHKQVQGDMHLNKGECAIGVLHLAYHNTRVGAVRCWLHGRMGLHDWEAQYGLDSDGMMEVIRRNDQDGWDFLTIARKVGREDEA